MPITLRGQRVKLPHPKAQIIWRVAPGNGARILGTKWTRGGNFREKSTYSNSIFFPKERKFLMKLLTRQFYCKHFLLIFSKSLMNFK